MQLSQPAASKLIAVTTIGVALAFAIALSLQYPLSTTFPIGGDAARLAFRAQSVIDSFSESIPQGFNKLSNNSNYPVTTALLALSGFTTYTWPARLVLFTVTGHILSAVAVGYVTLRSSNWRSAAFSMAAWAIAALAFTRHVEDGTLAQLLSLPLLVVVFERWWTKKWIMGTILLVITYGIHPLSAAIAIITGLWATIYRPPTFRRTSRITKIVITLSVLGAIIIAILFIKGLSSVIPNYNPSEEGVSLHDLMTNPIGPLILLAPIGYISLRQTKSKATSILISFGLLATFLIFHFQYLGASALLTRFFSYFALAVALLTGPALDFILGRLFPKKVLIPSCIAIILFIGLGLQTWQRNIPMFQYYESPGQYGRIHISERQGIEWMQENLPTESVIVTTKVNRHSEWIPVLTQHKWVGLSEGDPLFSTSIQNIAQLLQDRPYTHVAFFLKRENAQQTMQTFSAFNQVYSNDGMIIITLAHHES